jgi:GT2 family glycosyltransferase
MTMETMKLQGLETYLQGRVNTTQTASTPLVSIIISNYNGRKLIESCLDSVLHWSQGIDCEVIVIDACSTDGSVEFIKTHYKNPNLKVLAFDHRIGLAESNDIGLMSARGKYVMFLDNDVIIQSRWLEPLISAAESSQRFGAAQPMLISLNSGKIDTLGGMIDCFGNAIGIAAGETPNRHHDTREVFFPRGAAFFANKQALISVGGFDPDFFLGYEEIDPSWRLWLAGYQVLSIPSSRIMHAIGRTSSRRPIGLSQFHGKKNQIAMLIKNYELTNVLKYLPLQLLLLNLFEMLLALLVGKPSPIVSYWQAVYWNIKNIRRTLEKRCYVQLFIRVVRDSEIRSKVMLSFGDYLRRRFAHSVIDSLLWKD